MLLSDVLNIIHLGDCLEVLKRIPSDSVSSCVTDPPYGMGTKEPTAAEIDNYLAGGYLITGDFMGAKWDIPSVPIWKEILRVLIPGAYCLAFASTRTFDLMDAGMRAAGFTDADLFTDKFGANMLQWVQAQGMPKSRNVYKDLQKMGLEGEELAKWKGYGTALKPSWEPILVFRKPGPVQIVPDITTPFIYSGKTNKREATLNGRIENPHPTKKPVKIMRRLVSLVTPTGGTVLDPYVGSGTTAQAAAEEGFSWIGIERDPAFHMIAATRMGLVMNDIAAEQEGVDVDLFDLMESLSA